METIKFNFIVTKVEAIKLTSKNVSQVVAKINAFFKTYTEYVSASIIFSDDEIAIINLNIVRNHQQRRRWCHSGMYIIFEDDDFQDFYTEDEFNYIYSIGKREELKTDTAKDVA